MFVGAGDKSTLTIPRQVDAHEAREAHKGMTHESDATALGRAAEKGNLDLVGAQLLGKVGDGGPRARATGVLVILEGREVGAEASVSLNNAAPADLQKRDERGSEVEDALAGHRVSLLVDALDVPEAGLLLLLVGAHDNGDDIQLEPETRAERRAHVLERGGQAGTDELGVVFVLVALDCLNDIVGNAIIAGAALFVKHEMLDGEVDEVDRVMDGESHDGRVVVGKNGRNADI